MFISVEDDVYYPNIVDSFTKVSMSKYKGLTLENQLRRGLAVVEW